MKQKVAITATCLSLILCIAFLVLCASFARTAISDSALAELTRLCRLSMLLTDSAVFDEQGTVLRLQQATSAGGVSAALYDTSGALIYSTRPGVQDALTQEELAEIHEGKVTAMERHMRGSDASYLFALGRVQDTDRILSVYREGFRLIDGLGGRLVPLCMLALLVATIILILLQMAVTRTNRFVNDVQRVLEDFSEGQFDSRLQNVQGDSLLQTAHFNEVMGRIQDRVFRQKTRNQALNTVINHMQNGILAVDDNLNVILVTPAAKHLLNIVGSPEGQPISQASRDVFLDQVLRDAMAQEGVYMNEVAIRSTVGRSHTPLRLYISPMMKDAKAVGAVALVEDITELRRLEQVRTDFAANISHELKTPLTSIKGFVETLENGAIDNPEMAHKFLRIIMLEADRLTRLINDILSITKLESGKDEVPSKRIRIDEMACDIADMLSIQAAEKEVTIHAPENNDPSYIMGNPDRVEQMLINLIENAIKYNKPGGEVTVTVSNTQDTVNLSISDTGIGIPEESLPRLFERFYRVDKGRSRNMGGTGLGLAIVKHLVRTMDGLIEVHSKFGEGTEFLITLPRVQGEPELDCDPFED